MVIVYLIQRRSWWNAATLNPHPVYTVTCWVFDLAKCDRDYKAKLELKVATQRPVLGQLSSLWSLLKLLFCQAHVDVLKQQHSILACASASWGTNVCFSTFFTKSVLNSALRWLAKVQSVHKIVFWLPLALPCLETSTSPFTPVEKYVMLEDIFPANPDKQLHIKNCYLQLEDYSTPLSLPTKTNKQTETKKKRSHQILN